MSKSVLMHERDVYRCADCGEPVHDPTLIMALGKALPKADEVVSEPDGTTKMTFSSGIACVRCGSHRVTARIPK